MDRWDRVMSELTRTAWERTEGLEWPVYAQETASGYWVYDPEAPSLVLYDTCQDWDAAREYYAHLDEQEDPDFNYREVHTYEDDEEGYLYPAAAEMYAQRTRAELGI